MHNLCTTFALYLAFGGLCVTPKAPEPFAFGTSRRRRRREPLSFWPLCVRDVPAPKAPGHCTFTTRLPLQRQTSFHADLLHTTLQCFQVPGHFTFSTRLPLQHQTSFHADLMHTTLHTCEQLCYPHTCLVLVISHCAHSYGVCSHFHCVAFSLWSAIQARVHL